MRIAYDAEVDILTIVLAHEHVEESEEVIPGVVVDFNASKHPVAFEIFDASKFTDLSHVDVAVARLAKRKAK
jgi:uncharacterized protein YuzE